MRYASKPRAFRDSDWAWEPDAGGPASITVHADESATFSGLYDADGNELHRELPPIGFRLSK